MHETHEGNPRPETGEEGRRGTQLGNTTLDDTLLDHVQLDLAALGDWMRRTMPGAVGELHARLLAGGNSNLSYEIGDGRSTWVLRRPPPDHLLATAHDMTREHRVLAALASSSVPVPPVRGICTDPGVIGAPFVLMDHIDGTAYRHRADIAGLDESRVQALSRAMIETLVLLHSVDAAEVGLADFGRPDGFLPRQLRRWRARFDASRTRDLPLAELLHDRLAAAVPARPAEAVIVHGDFRLDNLLMGADDRPAAVIDWEMAALGDPLTDLGLMLVYRMVGRLPGGEQVGDAMCAPGFLTEAELVAGYAEQTGRDVGRLGFYVALGCYKLAALSEGVIFRAAGRGVIDAGLGSVADVVEPLLQTGIDALAKEDF